MTFDENVSPERPGPVSPGEPSADTQLGSGRAGSHRLLTSVIVALTVIAAVITAHGASATVSQPALEQPQPAASSYDLEKEKALWHRQELLSDLNYWIGALPGIKSSGYVTSIDDPEAGSTILVWHGPPDQIQRKIIDEARRRHIPISIQQRKYSMDDLERAANQLAAVDSGTGEFQNFKVSGVGSFSIDFDGVTVIGEYIHPPAEGIPAADTALTQALTAITGVAVTIEHGEIVPA